MDADPDDPRPQEVVTPNPQTSATAVRVSLPTDPDLQDDVRLESSRGDVLSVVVEVAMSPLIRFAVDSLEFDQAIRDRQNHPDAGRMRESAGLPCRETGARPH